ncbi:MAG: PEP-CTERM sorting domain-containing protein [Planctomycetota bacterium]|jgi:hypothetical protein
MEKGKTILILSVLLTVTSLAADAFASITEILPESSHYQGRSYYGLYANDGILSGRIDFAVYDTAAANQGGWGDRDNPGQGRYVYAYQILADEYSTVPVEFFGILGIGEGAIADDDDIDSQDDLSGEAIEPTESYFNSSLSKAFYEFEDGLLLADEHSWFLVISSNQDWQAGTYTFDKTASDEVPIPEEPIPEPVTIVLFGLGGTLFLIKHRKRA